MASQETASPARDRMRSLSRTAEAAFDACQRVQEGVEPLDAPRSRLLDALAAGAALTTVHGPATTRQAAVAACAEILRVYTWFWSALHAIERDAPGTLDQLPPLITPMSVLDAMALPTRGFIGMGLAQQTIAALVAWLRTTGRLGPAEWDDAQHPFTIAYYPLVGGGGLAILRHNDAVVAYADVSEEDDRVEDVVVLNGQLLPLIRGGRMRLADPRPALARLLARTVANLRPEHVVSALGVTDEVGARVLYGPNPEGYLGLVRLTTDQLADDLSDSDGHVAIGAAPRSWGYESDEDPDALGSL
ncbi:hypothetical protein TW95_gp1767 [Pandoravirus inopinatum]|uniref:DUF5848 domain-containing protein n=1 Tax=Pandoravirus inopinatum TaxID=1605721 RepID=A0A0B5JBU1_9VIRU|nr:hypothetical protein TW95_gp1767 [Pandoravirus inopinatum]AJF98501.1 hypothetical protein [Pandoravirus inopinatum]